MPLQSGLLGHKASEGLMKKARLGMVMGGLAVALLDGSSTRLLAQHPTEDIEWNIMNLRASGQPVIPIFEGWYERPDGTFDLCFGYFNLNTEEVLDIPLGPDNFIEPSQFNGRQP